VANLNREVACQNYQGKYYSNNLTSEHKVQTYLTIKKIAHPTSHEYWRVTNIGISLVRVNQVAKSTQAVQAEFKVADSPESDRPFLRLRHADHERLQLLQNFYNFTHFSKTISRVNLRVSQFSRLFHSLFTPRHRSYLT
jgi:hypothetical protein